MSRDLLALTVLQPFATGIASWGKDVENRTWLPGRRLTVGAWLAIHAGARDYADADSEAFRRWIGSLADHYFPPGYLAALPHGAIVAVARIAAFSDLAAKASPWAVPGNEQWRFDRVYALAAPVPCKGAQGLWRVPDDVAAAVRAAVAAATLTIYPVQP
jgi:hypothetical protein